MKIKPHQFQHHANARTRIRACIKSCSEPESDCGTFYGSVNLHKAPEFTMQFQCNIPMHEFLSNLYK